MGSNEYKLKEVLTLNFCNVALELQYLKETEESEKVYKEGYKLAVSSLGPDHKLTMLLKTVAKKNGQNFDEKKGGGRSNRSERSHRLGGF